MQVDKAAGVPPGANKDPQYQNLNASVKPENTPPKNTPPKNTPPKNEGQPKENTPPKNEGQPTEYTPPKNEGQLKNRQKAASDLQEALRMPEGDARKNAIADAKSLATMTGLSPERVDSFVNKLASDRAKSIRASRATKADRYNAEKSMVEYSAKAAEARLQGFTGVGESGGLAELYQMQADKAAGVAPGTYTALSKGSKPIAPDWRIQQRLASKVAKGEMTPEGAGQVFADKMEQKMAYDEPRVYAEQQRRRRKLKAEAVAKGVTFTEKAPPPIRGQLSASDRRRELRAANKGRGPYWGGSSVYTKE